MKPILELHSVSKKYTIGHSAAGYLSFRERLINLIKPEVSEKEEFWALSDVSFEVAVGESIGIIGRNGAGKSTLLKMLSKITRPTKGKIVQRGRIASLLEVGTGFHHELTGRENIFFNGSILGMKRREIISKFDEIVDFSGTEKFLDTALKHYSSGMQLRLAFSVAAFLEPEIMIIDEVLAVGDAEFQKKCLGKMEDVSKSGRTILFVSHNMAAVENLCRSAILLDRGRLVMKSTVRDVLGSYRDMFEQSKTNTYISKPGRKEKAYFKSISVELHGVQPKLTLRVKSVIASTAHHKNVFIAFDIASSVGVAIMQAIPRLEPFIPYSTSDQSLEVEIQLPPLVPDTYRVSVWIGSHNTETICWERDVVGFEITDSPTEGRTFPHNQNNGFLVPKSFVVNG